MPPVPPRFLVRVCHPCRRARGIPREKGERLLDLPAGCRVESYAGMGGPPPFADVRIAWTEFGLGVQVTVTGKKEPPAGDVDRPRQSDGLTLWLDTRDDRTSHRASRYCHQFHLLPAAGGSDRDEPAFVQSKVHRALADAPLAPTGSVPFRARLTKGGYWAEAFLPAAALNGFDPEEHPRLGFYYAVRDAELGEQTLGVGGEFPYADDPSLWELLELRRDG